MNDTWNRLWTSFESASDQQRLERLEQCRVLEEILASCRRQQQQQQQQQQNVKADSQRNNGSWFWPFTARQASIIATDTATAEQACDISQQSPLSLENTSAGVRMLRFFHWRELPSDFPLHQTACLREEHALWACRAVAVGCGKPLTKLRDCFDKQGASNVLLVAEASRTNPKRAAASNTTNTCYESENANANQPCHDMQRAVGTCVASNLYDLQQRVAQRTRQQAVAAEQPQQANL
ncbi:hypothetical protein MPSEU_000176800 [Mayamaea pseudoterrestris]|nr:hypothetical protein MPSEU_000176800 [Mayamaea pseudoterrestris]